MSRIRPAYLDAAPSDQSVAADVLFRQEPDEEDEEKDNGEEDDEDDDNDDGYSE